MRIRGYLAESPYLALHPSSQPSRFTVIAGRLAARVIPKKQIVQKLDSQLVSRDPLVNKEWLEDELCHDTGTLEGLAGMLDRGDELDKDLVIVREKEGEGGATRIFVGHGSGDRVTDFETSRRWVERLDVKDKAFKVYEGWYHKRKSPAKVVEIGNESAELSQCMRSLETIRSFSQMMLLIGFLPGLGQCQVPQNPRASYEAILK